MSRKMGTGSVGPVVMDWNRADFFAAPGGAILVAGALGFCVVGFWVAACANSKLTANEIRLRVRATGMKCDCTASQCKPSLGNYILGSHV